MICSAPAKSFCIPIFSTFTSDYIFTAQINSSWSSRAYRAETAIDLRVVIRSGVAFGDSSKACVPELKVHGVNNKFIV